MTHLTNGKIYPFHLISKSFGKYIVLHPSFSFKRKSVKLFLWFYKEIIRNWKTHFGRAPEAPSCILCQLLWCNNYVQINTNDAYFIRLSEKKLNNISLHFDTNTFTKSYIKSIYLNNNNQFQWLQLTSSIPEKWKYAIITN